VPMGLRLVRHRLCATRFFHYRSLKGREQLFTHPAMPGLVGLRRKSVRLAILQAPANTVTAICEFEQLTRR